MSVKDKHVYLLAGQRGAGKTSYAKRLLANQPELLLISRDEILQSKFGSTDVSPYEGGHEYAVEVMYELLRTALQTRDEVNIVLDCWTGDSRQRSSLVRNLRDFGATRITALYFVTPKETVDTWFWLKPGIARLEEMGKGKAEGTVYYSADAPKLDYDIFHQLARQIDSDGFDQVIRIDPRNETIFLEGCTRAGTAKERKL